MRGILMASGATLPVLLISVAAVPGSALGAAEPLCRRAPQLTQLGPEQTPRRNQQNHAVTDLAASEDSREPSASPPPPPPPPAPPPPPSPVVVPNPASDGAISESPVPAPSPMGPPRAARPSAADRDSSYATGAPGYMRPPAGLLTAGDHDDLLNPLLYARYAARAARALGQQITALPKVDTRRTLTVTVQDPSGRPQPLVPVTITCADGNTISLRTLADGRVVLFPTLDRLGKSVVVSAGDVKRTVVIAAASGGQEHAILLNTAATRVRKFDLMIALDSTGSMGDEIEFLKSELQSILADIRSAYPELDVRVGLVAYRDTWDEYVTRTSPLTSDFATIQRSLDRTSGRGGGDLPEALDQALIRAVGQDWRPDAVKSLLLVADAPPHDELQGRAFAAAEAARERRIQIVPVASSGVDHRAEYFMRAIAAATQSRYIFLTDDSGVGNPHAEPDVDCYVVTQLATAIRRVLASQISGGRVEPSPAEVIRVVGRYENGRCILPPAFEPK